MTRAATNSGSATMQCAACQRLTAWVAVLKASTSTPCRAAATRSTTWPVCRRPSIERETPTRQIKFQAEQYGAPRKRLGMP